MLSPELFNFLTAVTLLVTVIVLLQVLDKFHTRINKRSTKRKVP